MLNKEEEKIPYNKIFTGNIGEQVSVFRRFQKKMENREKNDNEEKRRRPPRDPRC